MGKILVLMLFFVSLASAQEKSAPAQVEGDAKPEQAAAKEEVATAVEQAPAAENRWGLYGTFSYLDTWLPGKLGLTASYGSEHRVYELAYQTASLGFEVAGIDLGKITDTRIHLSTRSHTWEGSFNFQYGVYYNSFDVKLGNTYTDIAGVSANVLAVKTLGAMWGFGNRWKWDSGWAFGVDYFKIFWPFLDMGGESDYVDQATGTEKEDAEKVIDAVGSLPTLSILHLEFGYRF